MLWNSGFKRSSGCYVSNFCSTSEAEWFLSLFCAQRFTGHSTAVTTLRFATTRPPDSNGLYFLSGAAHDRLLSVWWVSPLELFLMWCHDWARLFLFFATHAFMKPTWHWLSVGKCEKMERTRIRWCPSRWQTSRDTSTSSRPTARKR